MNQVFELDERTAVSLQAKLARSLTKPFDYVHPSHYDHLEPGGEVLQKLARHPAFREPIEYMLANEFQLVDLGFSRQDIDRLFADRTARTALLITVAERNELLEAARLVAAAILHRQLLSLVARSDRRAAMDQLGRTAFQVGIREAATLYGALGTLCPDSPPSFAKPETEPAAVWMPESVELGVAWLFAVVKSIGGTLERLFELRVPRDFQAVPNAAELDERCSAQLRKLLGRKLPGWSICTA